MNERKKETKIETKSTTNGCVCVCVLSNYVMYINQCSLLLWHINKVTTTTKYIYIYLVLCFVHVCIYIYMYIYK